MQAFPIALLGDFYDSTNWYLLDGCKQAYFRSNISDYSQIPAAARQFLTRLEQLQQTYPDARLGAVVAFGDKAWKTLGGQDAPELKPFVTLGKGDLTAPSTQTDLLVHIQSLRLMLIFLWHKLQ